MGAARASPTNPAFLQNAGFYPVIFDHGDRRAKLEPAPLRAPGAKDQLYFFETRGFYNRGSRVARAGEASGPAKPNPPFV
jgi:hypothetical protein